MERFIYPAVVLVCPEGGYFAKFPDLDGCMTQGETMQEIHHMTREVLEGWLYLALKDGETLPEPSKPEDIEVVNEDGLGGFVTLVEAWVEDDADERNKTVRANVTLPRWMKEQAQLEGLNLSAVLQNGIRRALHIDRDGVRRITPPSEVNTKYMEPKDIYVPDP